MWHRVTVCMCCLTTTLKVKAGFEVIAGILKHFPIFNRAVLNSLYHFGWEGVEHCHYKDVEQKFDLISCNHLGL